MQHGELLGPCPAAWTLSTAGRSVCSLGPSLGAGPGPEPAGRRAPDSWTIVECQQFHRPGSREGEASSAHAGGSCWDTPSVAGLPVPGCHSRAVISNSGRSAPPAHSEALDWVLLSFPTATRVSLKGCVVLTPHRAPVGPQDAVLSRWPGSALALPLRCVLAADGVVLRGRHAVCLGRAVCWGLAR